MDTEMFTHIRDLGGVGLVRFLCHDTTAAHSRTGDDERIGNGPTLESLEFADESSKMLDREDLPNELGLRARRWKEHLLVRFDPGPDPLA